MEKTFQDNIATKNDAERQQDNAQRAEQGKPQIPGAAGRESVASKDPKGNHSPPSFPNFFFFSVNSCADFDALCSLLAWQSSTLEAAPVPWVTSLSRILLSK